jgi:hypothetical protein
MIVFDIETGPLPNEILDQCYTPPPQLPPWDEAMVKYGNIKDEAKKAEKRVKVMAEYEARLAGQADEHARHKAEWMADAALSATTGRVVAIGTLMDDREPIIWSAESLDQEPELLRRFWTLCERAVPKGLQFVGHNSHGFDLPFLCQRSFVHGMMPWPGIMDGQRRYWCPQFLDTMRLWGCGVREYVKLDVLGRTLGVGGKADNGCDGAGFAAMWLGGDAEERAKAAEYLKTDLRVTRDVARRMGVE